MGTVSERVCKTGCRSWTGRVGFGCPAPGPARHGYRAPYRSLQREMLIISNVVGGAEKARHTWNSVVQDEPKESSNEHVGCAEHHDHLVQLFQPFQRRR